MRRIFGGPAVFFAVSGAGLVAALLGDGAWDAAAALAVAAPLAAILWFWLRRD